MNNRGITLVELIVAVSIIGILIAAFGFSFVGWRGSYRVESQIKMLYTDMMTARTKAMAKNRAHFVNLETTQYTVYEDTNTSPDGNGTLESGSDTKVLQTKLYSDYPITWSGTAVIGFSVRGLSDVDKTICSNTTFDVDADYDCIVVSSTRILLGKLTTSLKSGGACTGGTSSGNCVTK